MPALLDLPYNRWAFGVEQLHADFHERLLSGELIQKVEGFFSGRKVAGDNNVFTHDQSPFVFHLQVFSVIYYISNRLKEGFLKMRNPHQEAEISLYFSLTVPRR
jgi:hypothetical protein